MIEANHPELPSPQDLRDFLVMPTTRKCFGQMAESTSPDSPRCCLGHYAFLAEIKFRPEASVFAPEGGETNPNWTAPRPTLPDDHWLFAHLETDDDKYDISSRDVVQSVLAQRNDEGTGFHDVIAFLDRVFGTVEVRPLSDAL